MTAAGSGAALQGPVRPLRWPRGRLTLCGGQRIGPLALVGLGLADPLRRGFPADARVPGGVRDGVA
jgi:hypothetical protein